MMGRVASVFTCALVIGGAAIACDSFSEGAGGPANDAGSDSNSPGDSGSTEDTGANPVADAGGPTFCTTQTGAVICDDFEQPSRDIKLAAPWDEVRANGPQEELLAAGNMSPNGFRVHGMFSDTDSSGFGKNYDIHGKKVRFAFDIKVDKLGDADNVGGKPVLGVATIIFSPGKELDVVLKIKDNTTNVLTGFVSNMMSGFPVLTDFSITLEPSLGSWTKVAVEYEPKQGTDQFRFYFGSGTKAAVTLDVDPLPDPTALGFGADVSNGPADVDVTFDNVLITELP